jgi:hypothetical protein
MVFALQVMLASPPAPLRIVPDTQLKVIVDDLKRAQAGEVELHIALRNETNHDVYLPIYGTGGAPASEIRTLTVYQWLAADKKWRALGSDSELPIGAVTMLRPGETLRLVKWLQDPIHIPRSGELVPLRGKYKISVIYFASEQEWKEYRIYVEGIGRSANEYRPRLMLRRAESSDFELPLAPRTKSYDVRKSK